MEINSHVLNHSEVEQVNGGLLLNLGRGVAGAASGMGAYSLSGAGGLSGCGFIGAGVGGFIGGFTGSTWAGGASGGVAYNICEYISE